MKKTFSILIALSLVLGFSLVAVLAVEANDTASSTMIFQGSLTDAGGGVYTGTISMDPGTYYAVGGAGYGQRHGCTDTSPCAGGPGGFDVYAKAGGTAYVTGSSWIIGGDYDAYSASGPWGTWYTPDCADWCQYSLQLTANHWYLRYTPTGESPMSGVMYWYGDGTGYAAETDPGTVNTSHGGSGTNPTEYTAGSAQEWGWHCGWGEERIPLEYPGFDVTVTAGGGGNYIVTLTPAASKQSVATSTGTGTASFTASAGLIGAVTPLATGGPTPSLTLPHGIFSFKVTGLASGQTITITVTLPGSVPVGTRWWKYQGGLWHSLPIGDDDGDNVITVTLTDGVFPGDADNIAGQITDPGGPGYYTRGVVGWETYPINKPAVMAPLIGLLAAIIASVSLLVARRRRTQS